MNFKLGFIIFIVGFAFITSCTKENIDTTNVDEEEVVTDTIICNLNVEIVENNDSTDVLTALFAGGTAPFSFQWSTGETTESITPSSDGTFEVSVVDAEGCTATNSITFGESAPCDSLGVEIYVSGMTLTAYGYGGTAPYVYQWSWTMGGWIEEGQSVTVLNGGTYELTVIDSLGCTVSELITIDDPTPCDSLDVEIVFSGATLTAYVSGGTGPYTYSWEVQGNWVTVGQSVTIFSNGTYTVTVTDSQGCTVSTSIAIDDLDPCTSLDVTMVISVTTLTAYASGGTAPYTYQWSTGETSGSIIYLYDVAYEVTITDGAGCTVSDSITIDEPDPCQSLSVLPSQDSLTNILTAFPAGGTPPYAYQWSTGETTESITVSAVGIYTVMITDSEGCSAAFSYEVTFVPCIDLGVSFDFDAATSTLTASVNNGTPPYVYEWSSGETTNTIAVVSGNTYTVEITDADGCMGEDAYTVP